MSENLHIRCHGLEKCLEAFIGRGISEIARKDLQYTSEYAGPCERVQIGRLTLKPGSASTAGAGETAGAGLAAASDMITGRCAEGDGLGWTWAMGVLVDGYELET